MQRSQSRRRGLKHHKERMGSSEEGVQKEGRQEHVALPWWLMQRQGSVGMVGSKVIAISRWRQPHRLKVLHLDRFFLPFGPAKCRPHLVTRLHQPHWHPAVAFRSEHQRLPAVERECTEAVQANETADAKVVRGGGGHALASCCTYTAAYCSDEYHSFLHLGVRLGEMDSQNSKTFVCEVYALHVVKKT